MSEVAARVKEAADASEAEALAAEASEQPAEPEPAEPGAEPEPSPSEDEEGAEQEEEQSPAEPEPSEPAAPAGEPPAPEQSAEAARALGAESADQVVELEKAQATYLRKVEKIIGPAAMPPLCPTCEGTGLDFTGGAGEPEYRPSPDRETCPDCAGLGKVSSGSLVVGEEVLPCPTCQGAGHRVKLNIPPVPQLDNASAVVTSPPAWMGDVNASNG